MGTLGQDAMLVQHVGNASHIVGLFPIPGVLYEQVRSRLILKHQKTYEKNYSTISIRQHTAAVISGAHIESLPLGSKRFKNYICGAYYERFNSVPNRESITGAINVLKYKAEFKGPMIPLHLRVASSDGNDILYDLTDGGWNVIRVTPEGWNIEKSPIIFRRYSNQLAQGTAF